jgi:hypothetical protein
MAYASQMRYIARMKTSTLPPLRVEPRIRTEAERLLREGETLSSFIVDAVEERIRNRASEEEFVRRGLASAQKGRRSGRYVPASDVLAAMRQRLANAPKERDALRKRAGKMHKTR